MELLNRKFTSQSVAMATGLDAKAIQNWASRGLIVGQRDGTGKGHHLKFSWFNVMEIAIAAELIETGLSSLPDAFAAAQRFSHVSSGGAKWVGDDGISDDDIPFRDPGLPWHHNLGLTLLFVWKGGVAIRLTDYEGTVKLSSLSPEGHRAIGFVAVNVSEVFDRVCRRMALHPGEVLDEAYPDQATKV